MKYSSVSLINNKERYDGIEVFSKDFNIKFKKYDDNNNSNLNSFEITAECGDFGINSLTEIEK